MSNVNLYIFHEKKDYNTANHQVFFLKMTFVKPLTRFITRKITSIIPLKWFVAHDAFNVNNQKMTLLTIGKRTDMVK